MNKRRIAGFVLAAMTIGGAGSWVASRALAAGVPPTPGSIYYSGEITNVSGAPFTATSAHLQVSLWDRPAGGTLPYCLVDAPATPVVNGHFRLALDPAGSPDCVDAIHAHPAIWIELQVESETLPRQQIGAVPYALESAGLALTSSAGRSVSLGLFCGATDPVAGDVGGYAGAQTLCAARCGSVTAHMCTATELVLGEQAGQPFTGAETALGWYATGRFGALSATASHGDCFGYTVDQHNYLGFDRYGGVYDAAQGFPDVASCDTTHPIFCCD